MTALHTYQAVLRGWQRGVGLLSLVTLPFALVLPHSLWQQMIMGVFHTSLGFVVGITAATPALRWFGPPKAEGAQP